MTVDRPFGPNLPRKWAGSLERASIIIIVCCGAFHFLSVVFVARAIKDQPYHCQSAAGSTSTPATSGEVVPAPAMTVERQRRRLRNASAPAPAPAMEKWDRRTAACRQEIGAPTLVLRLRHLGAHTDPIPGAGKHAGASCASGAAWPVREAWEPPGPRPHPHIGSSSSVRSLTGGDRMDEAASAPRATGTREPACEAGGAVRSLRATASALQAGAALQAGLAAEPKGEKPCEGETDLPRLPPLSLLRVPPPPSPLPKPPFRRQARKVRRLHPARIGASRCVLLTCCWWCCANRAVLLVVLDALHFFCLRVFPPISIWMRFCEGFHSSSTAPRVRALIRCCC